MADLATQLRDYLEATAPAVSLSDIEDLRAVRPSPAPAAARDRLAGAVVGFAAKVNRVVSRGSDMSGNRATGTRTTRGWLIAVAATAVALVIALPLWFVFGGEETPPATTLPVTTTTAPSTTTQPTPSTTAGTTTTAEETTTTMAVALLPTPSVIAPTPPNLALSFEPLAVDLDRVLAAGPGFVGLGQTAFWVSSDGVAWTEVSDPSGVYGAEPVEGFRGQQPGGVIAWGGGFVVAGWIEFQEQGTIKQDAAVWVSADGSAWTRVPQQDSLGSPGEDLNQLMQGVAVGGPGLVAVGSSGNDLFTDQQAAVWLSTDGTTWTRLDVTAIEGGSVTPTEGPGTGVGAGMGSVVAFGSRLVASGGITPVRIWRAQPAIWVSEDGSSWDQILIDPGVRGDFGGSGIMSLAAGEHAVAAFGEIYVGNYQYSSDGYGAVWISEDGTDWRLAGALPPGEMDGPEGCSYRAQALAGAWSGDTLFVSGILWTACLEADAYQVVWATADLGATWHQVAKEPIGPGSVWEETARHSAAVVGSHLVITGVTDWMGLLPEG